jgi:putative DNA primase/helicase
MPDAASFSIQEPPKPSIEVRAGELDTLATQAEAAIRQSGLPVFQRGGRLFRPVTSEVPASCGRMTRAAGPVEMTRPAMIDALAQSAAFIRYDARRKKMAACDPPGAVADIVLSRSGAWTLPSIAGVITCPTLRPDGTVLCEPGYDPATRLYLVEAPDLAMPQVPAFPNRRQAEDALALLDGLLAEFPFAAPVARAVALSGLITPVIRGALPVAPLHAFRAPVAGSGKSFLVDLASAITTGRPCPVAGVSAKDGETESRLVGLLLAGFPIVSLDNVNGELGSDLLCQAVSQPLIRLRALGRSDILEIESRASLFATGNNLRVRGDMTRRTLVCTLDPQLERPELREFASNPVDAVLADRGRYVAAAIAIVRAYQHAGSPGRLKPLGSFEAWSDLVRSPLMWLGYPDPAGSMETARDEDPELSDLREALALWKQVVGVDRSVTCKVLTDIASSRYRDNFGADAELQYPEFHDAMHRIAGERGGFNTRRLGRWLLGHEGRIIDGLRIRKDGLLHGNLQWRLLDGC